MSSFELNAAIRIDEMQREIDRLRVRANSFNNMLVDYNRRGVFWCDACESFYGLAMKLTACPVCKTPADEVQLKAATR